MSTERNAAWKSAASALNTVVATLDIAATKILALETKLGLAVPRVQNQPTVPRVPPDAVQERAPWTWVSGETLPYRQELRDAGGRWSPKRKAWYFIDCTELPAELRNLPGTEVETTY